jgi:hypothetical protein
MKKSLMFGTALAAVVALTAGSPAKAACPTGVDSMPLVHGFGTAITNCKDASPVGFYAYQLGAEGTVTSGGQDGVCEAENPATNGIGQTCNPGPGVIGDGMVTVQYDWGNFNPGSVGCPTPVSQGVPTVVSQVVCNDGAGAIIAVGFEGNFGAYTVDLAFPLDPAQDIPTNVAADQSNSPLITGHAAGPSPSVSSVSVHLNPTHIWSDCDPTASGFGFSCLSAGPPTGGIGHLYTLNAPCSSYPDARLTAGWTLLSTQPDANGDATVTVTCPPFECQFIGATGVVGGSETGLIAGQSASLCPSGLHRPDRDRQRIVPPGQPARELLDHERDVHRRLQRLRRFDEAQQRSPAGEGHRQQQLFVRGPALRRQGEPHRHRGGGEERRVGGTVGPGLAEVIQRRFFRGPAWPPARERAGRDKIRPGGRGHGEEAVRKAGDHPDPGHRVEGRHLHRRRRYVPGERRADQQLSFASAGA